MSSENNFQVDTPSQRQSQSDDSNHLHPNSDNSSLSQNGQPNAENNPDSNNTGFPFDLMISKLFFQNVYKHILAAQSNSLQFDSLNIKELNQYTQYTDYLSFNLHSLSFFITRQYTKKTKFIKDKKIFTSSASYILPSSDQSYSAINQLVFPYLPLGTLHSYLEKNGKPSFEIQKKWAYQIATTLKNLYNLNSKSSYLYFHGNLSCSSFSLDENLNVFLTSIDPSDNQNQKSSKLSKLESDINSFGLILHEIFEPNHSKDQLSDSKQRDLLEDSGFAEIISRCTYSEDSQTVRFTSFDEIVNLMNFEPQTIDISSYECTFNTIFQCEHLYKIDFSLISLLELIFKSIKSKLPETDKYAVLSQIFLTRYILNNEIPKNFNENQLIQQILTDNSDDELFNSLDIPQDDFFKFIDKQFTLFRFQTHDDPKIYELFFHPKMNKLLVKILSDNYDRDVVILVHQFNSKFIVQNSPTDFETYQAPVVPFLPGFTLFSFLNSKVITEEDRIVWIFEIVEAMRDLYTYEGFSEEEILKAKQEKKLLGSLTSQSFMVDIHKNVYLASLTNIPSEDPSKKQYLEFYRVNEKDKRWNDIYAFGALIYEILTNDFRNYMDKSEFSLSDKAQENVKGELLDIINQCINDYNKDELTFDVLYNQLHKTKLYQTRIKHRMDKANKYDQNYTPSFRTLISAYKLSFIDSNYFTEALDAIRKTQSHPNSPLYLYFQRLSQSIPSKESQAKYSAQFEPNFAILVNDLFPQFAKGYHYQIDIPSPTQLSPEQFIIKSDSSLNGRQANDYCLKKLPILTFNSLLELIFQSNQFTVINQEIFPLNTLFLWIFQIVQSIHSRDIPLCNGDGSYKLSLDDFAIYFNNETGLFDADFAPATHINFDQVKSVQSIKNDVGILSNGIDIRSLEYVIFTLLNYFSYDEEQYKTYKVIQSFILENRFSTEFYFDDFFDIISKIDNTSAFNELLLNANSNESDYVPSYKTYLTIILPKIQSLIKRDIFVSKFNDFFLLFVTSEGNTPQLSQGNKFTNQLRNDDANLFADEEYLYFQDNASKEIHQINQEIKRRNLEPIRRTISLSGYHQSTVNFLIPRYIKQLHSHNNYRIEFKLQNVDLYQDQPIKSNNLRALGSALNRPVGNDSGVFFYEVKATKEAPQEEMSGQMQRVTTIPLSFSFNNSQIIGIMKNLKIGHIKLNHTYSSRFYHEIFDLSTCSYSTIIPDAEMPSLFCETECKFILHLSKTDKSYSFPLLIGFDLKDLLTSKGRSEFFTEFDKYVIIEEMAIAFNALSKWIEKTKTHAVYITDMSFFMDHDRNVYLCRLMNKSSSTRFKSNNLFHSFKIIASEVVSGNIINMISQFSDSDSDLIRTLKKSELGAILCDISTKSNSFDRIIESLHKTSFYSEHQEEIQQKINSAQFVSTRPKDKMKYECTFQTLALAYFGQFPHVDSILVRSLTNLSKLVTNKMAIALLQAFVKMTNMDNALNKYIKIFNSFVTIFQQFDMGSNLFDSLKKYHSLIDINIINNFLDLPSNCEIGLNPDDFVMIHQKNDMFESLYLHNGGIYFQRQYANELDYNDEQSTFTVTQSPFIIHTNKEFYNRKSRTAYLPFPSAITIKHAITELKLNLNDINKMVWAIEIATALRDLYRDRSASKSITDVPAIAFSDMSFFVDLNLNVYLSQVSYHAESNSCLSSTPSRPFIRNVKLSTGDDIYAYGLLLHEIFTLTNPRSINIGALFAGNMKHPFYAANPELKSLVIGCLQNREHLSNFPKILINLKSTPLYQRFQGLIEYRSEMAGGLSPINQCTLRNFAASSRLGFISPVLNNRIFIHLSELYKERSDDLLKFVNPNESK